MFEFLNRRTILKVPHWNLKHSSHRFGCPTACYKSGFSSNSVSTEAVCMEFETQSKVFTSVWNTILFFIRQQLTLSWKRSLHLFSLLETFFCWESRENAIVEIICALFLRFQLRWNVQSYFSHRCIKRYRSKTNNYYSEYLKGIRVTISLVCFLDSRNYGAVISLAQSNSLNKTILFSTTTKKQPWCRVSSDEGIFARARLQTASVLTEFDENPDL